MFQDQDKIYYNLSEPSWAVRKKEPFIKITWYNLRYISWGHKMHFIDHLSRLEPGEVCKYNLIQCYHSQLMHQTFYLHLIQVTKVWPSVLRYIYLCIANVQSLWDLPIILQNNNSDNILYYLLLEFFWGTPLLSAAPPSPTYFVVLYIYWSMD